MDHGLSSYSAAEEFPRPDHKQGISLIGSGGQLSESDRELMCEELFSLSLYTLVASNRLQLCYDLGASHTGCVVTVSGVSLQSYRSISELGILHVKSSVDLFQPMKMLHFHQCWSYEDPLLRIP